MLLKGKDAGVPEALCAKCSLNECLFVPGYGPDNAEVVIVGEAPGDTEVQRGRPFVGRAGQLLDKVLEEAGINREECYVTNACLCRPTPHRAPRAAEVKCCRPRLLAEVRARVPRLVLAMGNAALYALLGKRGIQDEHGTVSWSPDVNAFVIPTYHPAAVLRSPALYIDLVRDLHRAANILTGKNPGVEASPTVEYVPLTNHDMVLELIGRLRDVQEVAVDIETASDGSPLCIGFSWKAGTAVVVTKDALKDPRVIPMLNDALRDKTLIGHNLKYDVQELWRYGITNVVVGKDTMLMHYVLDERPGIHKLKPLARKYLNADDYEASIKQFYTHMEDCPPLDLWRYNAHDAAYTYALSKVLERELDADGRKVLTNLLYPGANVLARMEYLGVMVDLPYLQELQTKLQQQAQTLEQEMYHLAGKEFNPRSPKQIAHLLYNELGLPIPERMSTDERALTLLKQFHSLPTKLLEYRGAVKMLRTYVTSLIETADANARVHTNFNLHGTVTGRLSSSDPINLQNIPKTKEARDAFIATPGYTLIECDLSQAEVRVLAWYCKDPNLIQALSAGGDLHIRTACIMFHKQPEEVTPEMRQAAKRLTFGQIYGQSVEALARELGISASEARELQEQFFGAFPRVREWIRAQQELVLTTGVVTTPFKRKRRFEYITTENRAEVMRQAVNTPIQSVASDITLNALIRMGHKLGDSSSTRLLLTVHDSILLETAEDLAEVVRWVKKEMTRDVLDSTVPFDADVKTGERWGSLKDCLS